MNDFYKKNGYLLCKKLLDVSLLDGIVDNIHSMFQHKDLFDVFDQNILDFKSTANISQYLVSLNKMALNDAIIDVIKVQLGIELPVINTRPLISFSSKRTAASEMYWKLPAHQDWPSMQGSIDAVTAWFPLTNICENMGYLHVIPESHLMGALELRDDTFIQSEFDDSLFVPIKMEKGDVLFFSTFLVHKSGNNISDKIRLTSHVRFDNAKESSFIDRKFPHHRIDKRATGIIHPQLDTKELIRKVFTT